MRVEAVVAIDVVPCTTFERKPFRSKGNRVKESIKTRFREKAACRRIAAIESVVLGKEANARDVPADCGDRKRGAVKGAALKIIKAVATFFIYLLDVANGGGWYWWYRW